MPSWNLWHRRSANASSSPCPEQAGIWAPNLGVVELTLALHTVFETPKDKFVFDVSHQAYVHKMLTGGCDRLDTMRQPAGLNGFMLRTESEHDCYGAGHAGTALSAALGMAVARDLADGKEHVIALAGDAAFTNGISFEALNNIADQTKRLIVVLNDNEWSIDRNVGAIAKYLHKIVTNQHVSQLHESAGRLLARIGGKSAVNVVRRAEEAAKGMLWPSFLFEEFGLTYTARSMGTTCGQLVETFASSSSRSARYCCSNHPEGTRIPARPRQAEEVPRPRPLRSGDRQDAVDRPANLF